MPHTRMQFVGTLVGAPEQCADGAVALRMVATPRSWNGERWISKEAIPYRCTARGDVEEEAIASLADSATLSVTGHLESAGDSLLYVGVEAFGTTLGARMPDTQIQITGTAVGTAEVKFHNGRAITRFQMMSTPLTWQGRWVEQPAIHYVCTVWDEQGRNAAECVDAGVALTVTGRVAYLLDDVLYVEADAVGVSLGARIAYTAATKPRNAAAPCAPAVSDRPARSAETKATGEEHRDGAAPDWWPAERAGWSRPSSQKARAASR
ncbi:single-stranded DNA-binding protein [Streptomyces nanshensis]|uniref:Single-stranded DNA-binding protein n=1 Tax=Streptomyces nanshensis TaxID=518642 RepID=A0A1E7L470_9ACTN|nr:single-stranded DNA-binding protein [Streptomyces nanshensis]OEV10921.1 hypothetical protein AN218_15390 [Streptomyces nanshensis]